ncbi:uncharacterized protein LOC128952042 [Oppia nitens]|uniref:uncharacterized protein LOC128952042 n=1 Tax=Oppia nitens TaxID=1686743 RepID=UPI0023DBBF53|nr:uncharacterized protein LOC128952042 [Oppia nitens]XP_054153342.1 uncharacterized protein LOC128952042 [Oppia nitens]
MPKTRSSQQQSSDSLLSKKMKMSGNFMNLDDEVVELILSDLSLVNKLSIRSVNNKVKTCVDRLLAKQKCITFINTYGQSCDTMHKYDPKHLVQIYRIGGNFNDNNHCLVQLLAKLPNLKHVSFDNNITITNQMLEFIFNRSPQLDSLSLMDYRLNYHVFDWKRLGKQLADKLISLEIECRMNQQISDKELSHLVSQLVNLQELKIVGNRHMEKVFNNLGPKVVKLELKYCWKLTVPEIMVLKDKSLEKLVIWFQPLMSRCHEDIFDCICQNLTDLKTLKFNHFMKIDSMKIIDNLNQLKTFNYNFSGHLPTQAPNINFRVYFPLPFGYFAQPMPSLLSLKLTNISLTPLVLSKWLKILPNLRDLSLDTRFDCICLRNTTGGCHCCVQSCFMYLSHLKNLRSLHMANPNTTHYYEWLSLVDQITDYTLIASKVSSKFLIVVLNTLLMLATKSNRIIRVRLFAASDHIRRNIDGINWSGTKQLRVITD